MTTPTPRSILVRDSQPDGPDLAYLEKIKRLGADPTTWAERKKTATKVCARCLVTFSPPKLLREQDWKRRNFCSRQCAEGGKTIKSIYLPNASPNIRPGAAKCIPEEPVYYRHASVTPSSAYAHCDDCGTGAGESCYDSRDRPCAPCAGRVLASTGALDQQVRRAYKKRKREPKPVPEPAPPVVVMPAPIPCWYCGVSIPVMGGHRGRDWVPCCTSPECRRGRKLERARRVYEATGKAPPPRAPTPGVCLACGCPIGRRRRWCDAEACQSQRVTGNRDRHHAHQQAARPPPSTYPCWCCGGAITSLGRRGLTAARPSCGAADCDRAIGTARAAARDRTRPPRLDPAPEVSTVRLRLSTHCQCGVVLELHQGDYCSDLCRQTPVPCCPGCGASQSHTRHCSDLCAQISDLYLRAKTRFPKP